MHEDGRREFHSALEIGVRSGELENDVSDAATYRMDDDVETADLRLAQFKS